MSTLMTFGIPVHAMPLMPDGSDVTSENHRKTLENLKNQEENNQKAASKGLPGPNDVLFGRYTENYQHVGNLRFRKLIEKQKEKYDKADRAGRGAIASQILQEIKEAKGRFMKSMNDSWVEVDDNAARDKVTHTFRNLRKANPKESSGLKPNPSPSKKQKSDKKE